VEHTFYTGNANNREDDYYLTLPLGRAAIAGRGEDDADDGSSIRNDFRSGSSIYRYRSICKLTRVKKINKSTDRGKIPKQQ